MVYKCKVCFTLCITSVKHCKAWFTTILTFLDQGYHQVRSFFRKTKKPHFFSNSISLRLLLHMFQQFPAHWGINYCDLTLRSTIQKLSPYFIFGLSKERPILDHHAKAHIHEIRWISGEIWQISWNPLDFRWNPADFVWISPEIRQISCGFRADFERPIARNGKPSV